MPYDVHINSAHSSKMSRYIIFKREARQRLFENNFHELSVQRKSSSTKFTHKNESFYKAQDSRCCIDRCDISESRQMALKSDPLDASDTLD